MPLPEIGCRPAWTSFRAASLLLIAILWVEPNLPGRFTYSIVGAALIAVALYSELLCWHIVISLTVAAWAAALAEYFHEQRELAGPSLVWGFVGVSFVSVLRLVPERARLVTLWRRKVVNTLEKAVGVQ